MQVLDQIGAFEDIASTDSFSDPFQIHLSGGFAYVTDFAESVVKRISLSNGSVSTLAGKSGEFGVADGAGAAARFGQPAGVWSDDRNVYVTDAYFDTVRRISLTTGLVTTLAGSSTSSSGSVDGIGAAARFRSPNGLWGDGTHLYVSDTLNFTVRKIVIATGEVTTLAGSPEVRGAADGVGPAARFYAPLDIWGDSAYIYVTDGNAIRKVTVATGEVRTLAGVASIAAYSDGLGQEARFSFASGIWGDGADLFVADAGNDVVRKVSIETGLVTTLAGLPPGGQDVNGAGEARFDYPTDVTGYGGEMFVVDRMNSTIRKAATSSESNTQTPSGSAAPALSGAFSAAFSGAVPVPSSPASGIISAEDPANHMKFRLEPRAGTSQPAAGDGGTIQAGYGRILPAPQSPTPSGLAILGSRSDGILVSETSIPVSQLIHGGRVPVQIDSVVNTGIAVTNPNAGAASLTFYFSDVNGATLYSGAAEIPGGGQIAGFLDQVPFAPTSVPEIGWSDVRTFTFSSSMPVAVTALRLFINERSDTLMTALPVTPFEMAGAFPAVLPYYAAGAGWETQITLVNPTDSILTGVVDLFGDGSGATFAVAGGHLRESLPYSIPPRSAVYIQVPEGTSLRTGWIRITPSEGMMNPSGSLLWSYNVDGITVTEAALPAVSEESDFRLFVEASGNFNTGEAGSVLSGFAISNSSDSTAAVHLELSTLDGTPTGFHAPVTIPAYGQSTMFLDQLFQDLPIPFEGFLRISGSPVAVAGIRGRFNERGDFLIATTPPMSEAAPASSLPAESFFPYFISGGGFTTQFILFNGEPDYVSNGTVSFAGPAGQPLTLPYTEQAR